MSGDDIGGLKPMTPLPSFAPLPVATFAPPAPLPVATALLQAPGPAMTRLDSALNYAEFALELITELGPAFNPAVGAAGMLAERLLSVVQKGVAAHEAATGKPLDLSLLHPIALIP